MPGVCSSRAGVLGVLRKPAEHRVERYDVLHVPQQLGAEHLGHRPRGHPDPGVDHLQVRAADTGVGAAVAASGAVEEPLSRCGASRKSSADRLGGVSTTIRSICRRAGSWPASHRHVLLGAEARRQRPGREFARICAARSGSECASTISSKVRFMSSIMARRLPPSSARRRSGTGRGASSSEVRPIDWASRRAGPPSAPPRACWCRGPEPERGCVVVSPIPAAAAADDDAGARVVEQPVDLEPVRASSTSRACPGAVPLGAWLMPLPPRRALASL